MPHSECEKEDNGFCLPQKTEKNVFSCASGRMPAMASIGEAAEK